MSIVGSTTPPSPRRWGSVFDKLNDPATYTGVYAERFRSGPNINAAAEAPLYSPYKLSLDPSVKTDEPVKDIRFITRDYLNKDKTSPQAPLQRATSRNRVRLEEAEMSLTQPPAPRQSLRAQPSSRSITVDDDEGSVHPFSEEDVQVVPLDTNTQLQLIFQYYCRFGRTGAHGDEEDTIDSFNFVKLIKDCPSLMDRILTITEVDLIFTKCKTKHARRLVYGQFLDAISAIAAIKYHEDDATTAFSKLLAEHIFQCPASLGIAAAIRSGALRVEPVQQTATVISVPADNSLTTASMKRLRPQSPARDSAATLESNWPASALQASPGRLSRPGSARLERPPPADAIPVIPSTSNPIDNLTAPADVYELISRKTAEVRLASKRDSPTLSSQSSSKLRNAPSHYDLNGTGASPAASPGRASSIPPPIAAHTASTPNGRTVNASLYVIPTAVPERGLSPAASRRFSAARTERSVVDLLSPTGSAASIVSNGYSRPRSARLSRSPSRTNLGTPEYKPTIAGSANRPGGVYDRLSSPSSFTGVYRRAWLTDGRINHFSETGVSAAPSQFVGNTNTGSDEKIHDIRVLLRPNLRVGKFMR